MGALGSCSKYEQDIFPWEGWGCVKPFCTRQCRKPPHNTGRYRYAVFWPKETTTANNITPSLVSSTEQYAFERV